MHSLMLLLALAVATGARAFLPAYRRQGQVSLFFFLFPPLLLVMTAAAILCMGYRGQMFGYPENRASYCAAMVGTGFAGFSLLRHYYRARRARKSLENYPRAIVAGRPARLLPLELPYSARVGLWESELVITTGLLALLDDDHLAAVLAHENSHHEYRDTFWFFWLGWVASFSSWLPNSEGLWSELVFLRELRADRRAARQVDSLLLAESILQVAQKVNQISTAASGSPVEFPAGCGAALNERSLNNRLLERIDALMADERELPGIYPPLSLLLFLSLVPFLLLPWHT